MPSVNPHQPRRAARPVSSCRALSRIDAALSSRLASIGVRVSDTSPETRIATLIVIANSRNNRPRIPPMNSTGIKTATSETVIETMVKPISREPRKAASITPSPISMRRTMFSSITTASSTTKPTDSVRAIKDRLSRLKFSKYIAANVPTIEVGSASVGMIVARTLRRKRKITSTTRPIASTSENWTSSTDCRIEIERSLSTSRLTEAGSCFLNCGISARIASTTATVFVPGCRCTAMVTLRRPLNQLATRLFSTLSITFATSPRRTGEPLR